MAEKENFSADPLTNEDTQNRQKIADSDNKDENVCDNDDSILSKINHPHIDFKKPLVEQVYNMRKEKYAKLLVTPVFRPVVIRLFDSNVLEALSRTRPISIPLIWLPIAACSLACSVLIWHATWISGFMGYLLGLFTWTFLEYVLHRGLFHHLFEVVPDRGSAIVVHFLLHGLHHLVPRDPLHLVLPPALIIILNIPLVCLALLVLPKWLFFAGWAGVITGYVGYDTVHYTLHHRSIISFIPHVKEMKRYHNMHHFEHSNKLYGVTCKLWDHVFGTI